MSIFRVNRGEHGFNGWRPKWFHTGKSEFEGVFNFDESCIYNFSDIGDTERDINKLFGLSYGILPRFTSGNLIPAHHINSIRIGWRPKRSIRGHDHIEIFLYWYENGIRKQKSISGLPVPDTDYYIRVAIEGNKLEYLVADLQYAFDISDGIVDVDLPTNKWGYMLYPYFGGNAPAPWKMKIKLDNIKLY